MEEKPRIPGQIPLLHHFTISSFYQNLLGQYCDLESLFIYGALTGSLMLSRGSSNTQRLLGGTASVLGGLRPWVLHGGVLRRPCRPGKANLGGLGECPGLCCDPCRGRLPMNRFDPGVFGRVAASTPGYKLKSLRDL